MAITIPRYRILPLRGTYDALIAEFDQINDNEICYAIDRDQYYQREGNQLVQVGATKAQGLLAESAVQPVDLAAVATSGSYSDLSDKPNVVEVGDNISLLANNVGYVTEAPVNGDYYVRRLATWLTFDSALEATYGRVIDGGNLETGTAIGDGTTIDGGLIT
jgi:hypothetical protein